MSLRTLLLFSLKTPRQHNKHKVGWMKRKARKLFGQTGNGANLSRGKEKDQQEAFSSALGIKTVSQAYPGFLLSLASALSSSQDRFQTNFVGK